MIYTTSSYTYNAPIIPVHFLYLVLYILFVFDVSSVFLLERTYMLEMGE